MIVGKKQSMSSLDNLLSYTGKNCIFISPHLDDAVLSCSSLLLELAEKGCKTTIISIFTEGSSAPLSKDAAWILKTVGFENSHSYFHARRLEDQVACATVKAQCIHLGFTDALWRKKNIFRFFPLTWIGLLFPRLVYSYPSFQSIFLQESREKNLSEDIFQAIKNAIGKLGKYSDITLFFPLGIGNHVDHKMINTLSNLFKSKQIYWEDFPYNKKLEKDQNFFLLQKEFTLLHYSRFQIHKKESIFKTYKTQFYALFPNNKINLQTERFWIKSS